jgi:hypothetical protein
MKTPAILVIAFNRPEHAKKVFASIRASRPERLYVAIDGPREGKPADEHGIRKTIEILSAVDWPCTVKTLIRDKNLGVRFAPLTAIDWFFEHESEGIILEDDCVPSPSFFPFCGYLLEKYRENEKIMQVNGVNFQDGEMRGNSTYYFSRISHIWGWATWKRAWSKYDPAMEGLDEFFDTGAYRRISNTPAFLKYWKDIMKRTQLNMIETWDYQWMYAIWNCGGLCIAPNYNLVSNVGFDSMATHTRKKDARKSDRPVALLDTSSIKDCIPIAPHEEADVYSFRNLFSSGPGLIGQVRSGIKKLIATSFSFINYVK